jgi:hypothetical protein
MLPCCIPTDAPDVPEGAERPEVRRTGAGMGLGFRGCEKKDVTAVGVGVVVVWTGVPALVRAGGWSFTATVGRLSAAEDTAIATAGAARSSSSSGQQILHVQLSGSPVASVDSHNRCAKKSAGLLKRFFRPMGWPYR